MHNFKKEFGQNFLKNSKFAKSLVSNLALTDKDTVIEIGPGDGMVTKLLLESGAKVIAFEVDDDLIPRLSSQFAAYSNFTLVHQSILDANIKETVERITQEGDIKVVGSLPYNISKKIIDIFLKFNLNSTELKVRVCAFIIQEEVAKDYAVLAPKASFLSSYSRVFAKVRKLESIPRFMFFPEPKVNGGIIRFEIKESIPNNSLEIVSLIRIGFSNPRKTLLNNLKSSGKYNSDQIQALYTELNLPLTIRPAEIEASIWEKMYSILNP